MPGPSALTQTEGCEHGAPNGRRVHRVSWAKLLARVFQYDVRVCPSCSGRMKVIAALHYDVRFVVLASHPERFQISSESKDLKWFSLAEAYQITPEGSVHRQLDKLTQRRDK